MTGEQGSVAAANHFPNPIEPIVATSVIGAEVDI
jgi:hypothetical protein